jgi:hypothetical protein
MILVILPIRTHEEIAAVGQGNLLGDLAWFFGLAYREDDFASGCHLNTERGGGCLDVERATQE